MALQLPDPEKPWYIALLDWIVQTAKDNWSGIAMILWGYEEKKIDGAKTQQQTAELDRNLAANEAKIRKIYTGKSDADILNEFGSKPPDDTDT